MKRATEEEHAPRSHTGPETLTNADEALLHLWKTLSAVGISWPAVIMPLHTIRCHSLRSRESERFEPELSEHVRSGLGSQSWATGLPPGVLSP